MRVNNLTTRVFAVLVILLAAVQLSPAQQPTQKAPLPRNVKEEKLVSKLVGRDISYRVVLPVGYSDEKSTAIRYPVVYLLHGLSGHFDNWTDRTKLADYIAPYNMIIVTPEGDNGW